MCNRNKHRAKLLYVTLTMYTIHGMEQPSPTGSLLSSFYNLFIGNQIPNSAQPHSYQTISVQEYSGDSVEISFVGAQQISTTDLIELQTQYNQYKKHKITLRFINNQATKLPPKICSLMHLTHLDVSSNQLRTLPSTLGILTKLRVFSCHSNSLSDMPPTIKNLTNLTSLNIARNNFEQLPNVVLALTTLQSLSFACNKINELPPDIQNLKNIRYLYTRENLLCSVPTEITYLQKLEILDLSNNQLTALPQELSNCTQLRVLNLLDNSQLPLRKIKELYPVLLAKLGGKLQTNRDEMVEQDWLRIGTPEPEKPVAQPLILSSSAHRVSPETNQLALDWLVDLLKNLKFW